MSIKERITLLRHQIPSFVRLLAATKLKTSDQINEGLQSGINLIGENRVQEAEKKFPLLAFPCEKHLIGHLQGNKVQKAVELFDCIETVDSKELTKKIAIAANILEKRQNIFIQVNISQEAQKSGVDPENLEILYNFCTQLKNIEVRGLMTIIEQTDDLNIRKKQFSEMQSLYTKLIQKHHLVDFQLSMGMSGDWKEAVECGATIIRLGTAIFGTRTS